MIGGSFNLTPKEQEILASFIDIHISTGNKNVFTPEYKKQVADKIGLKDFNGLNTFIQRLRAKKAISKQAIGYSINSALIPNDQGVIFIWKHVGN